MRSLGEALRYPMESDEWIKTVLIGGVLSILGFLLIPLLPVYGYLVRVIRYNLAGDPEPPTFGDWGELFTDGIQFLVIGIVYLLVPAIVGTFTVGGSIAAIATGTQEGAMAGLAGLAVGFLLTFLLSLVFGYIGVAAILNFVHEDRLGAAFDFDAIRTTVMSRDYAVAWLLSLVVFLGASIVSGVLNVVPFLGAIVSAFVFFYVEMVAATLWADGYRATRDVEMGSAQSRAEESTA